MHFLPNFPGFQEIINWRSEEKNIARYQERLCEDHHHHCNCTTSVWCGGSTAQSSLIKILTYFSYSSFLFSFLQEPFSACIIIIHDCAVAHQEPGARSQWTTASKSQQSSHHTHFLFLLLACMQKNLLYSSSEHPLLCHAPLRIKDTNPQGPRSIPMKWMPPPPNFAENSMVGVDNWQQAVDHPIWEWWYLGIDNNVDFPIPSPSSIEDVRCGLDCWVAWQVGVAGGYEIPLVPLSWTGRDSALSTKLWRSWKLKMQPPDGFLRK